MSEEEKEFKFLESKIVGNDTVVFQLENGAKAIVKVEIIRAGVRQDEQGNEEYHIDFNNFVKIVPAKKTFKIKLPTKGAIKGYVK